MHGSDSERPACRLSTLTLPRQAVFGSARLGTSRDRERGELASQGSGPPAGFWEGRRVLRDSRRRLPTDKWLSSRCFSISTPEQKPCSPIRRARAWCMRRLATARQATGA